MFFNGLISAIKKSHIDEQGEFIRKEEFIIEFEYLITHINISRKNEKYITFERLDNDMYSITDEALSEKTRIFPFEVLPRFYIFYFFMQSNHYG